MNARWTALVGSSIGELISHYAMHRHPAVFGKVGVFSPAYCVAPQMDTLVRARPLPATARVYFYAGGHESDEMVPDATRMHALLLRQGAASRLYVAPRAATTRPPGVPSSRARSSGCSSRSSRWCEGRAFVVGAAVAGPC